MDVLFCFLNELSENKFFIRIMHIRKIHPYRGLKVLSPEAQIVGENPMEILERRPPTNRDKDKILSFLELKEKYTPKNKVSKNIPRTKYSKKILLSA